MNREKIFQYVKEKYQTEPDYPWEKTPDAAVLRHKGNRKWYGLFMRVSKNRLGLCGDEEIEILNIKCGPVLGGTLKSKDGILRAYHMNKENWVTVLLDGPVPDEEILSLLDVSYHLTKS